MSKEKESSDPIPHVESSDSEEFMDDMERGGSDSDSHVEESTEDNNDEYTCHIGLDGIKFYTPKCDEEHKPKLNQHFPTLEHAYQFYREYGRLCGFDVIKSTEKSDRRGNLYAKYYQCSRGGKPDTNYSQNYVDNPVQGPRKRTTSKRCQCKARIIMKVAGLRGFVLMGFVEEHNHPLATGAANMFLRCNRNLSYAYQNFIMDCSRANIGPTRAHNLVKEMTGSFDNIGATVEDFKNFNRDVKSRIGAHDSDMILDRFKSNKAASKNSFYYDYKVDSEGRLTGLFWTDTVAQANYDVFGDIVSFDPTFRTNRYNMVFVPFTGVNNHWKNVTFAAGLLEKEDYKNFKWLVNAFVDAMGRPPRTVITDQCPAIKKALDKWWPSTTHRLCMWHIMNKLPMKVGPKLSSNKKFVDRLKSVVYSDHLTPSEFESDWKAVMAEYNLEDNAWLNEMFDIRAQWIPAYFSDIEMAGLLRTTSRSESSNSFFQHFHESGDTLREFYSSFESAMDKQRLINATDDKRSHETPKTETSLRIELDASKVYTLEIYYLVREQIKSGCYHNILNDRIIGTDSSYFKFKDELLNNKVFEVTVRHCDNYVECTCKLFFQKGYLCSHAFAALHHCGVKEIPRELVKARWTKDAIKNHSFLLSSELSNGGHKKDRAKLKRTRAWFEFNSSINLAGDDMDQLDLIVAGLESITNSLNANSKSANTDDSSHRADKFVGTVPRDEILIQNPNISRNKGCGSRLKSSRELSAQDRKKRKCGICNQLVRHNARTCPEAQKDPAI